MDLSIPSNSVVIHLLLLPLLVFPLVQVWSMLLYSPLHCNNMVFYLFHLLTLSILLVIPISLLVVGSVVVVVDFVAVEVDSVVVVVVCTVNYIQTHHLYIQLTL